MQKILPLVGLFLVFACSPEDSLDDLSAAIDADTTSAKDEDSNTVLTNRDKTSLLTYFDALIANEQVIVGQQCGDTPDSTAWYYNTYVEQLADETGKHVGLIGGDFGWFLGDNYPVQTLIDHWDEGGLVTMTWHADNPFVAGVDVFWDTIADKDKINLKALLKDADDSNARTSYRTELHKVAGALQKLRDAGVTVIWRPFHEMNGSFFWWGTNAYSNQQTNEPDYKALWIDLYNTFKFDYGLDNLIWTYSVVPSETWYAEVTAYYPGTDYVDLVGMDYYGAKLDFPHYEELRSLGKPVVMSESGPWDEGYGNWNMMDFANILKGKAAYFMQWHSWTGAAVAIKDNKNSIEMMNSETVITRDELNKNLDL